MSLPHTFAVGRKKAAVETGLLQWETDYANKGSAIAWYTATNNAYLNFAVPIGSSSTSYEWQYSLGINGPWTSFGRPDTVIDVPEGFLSNGQVFYYYVKSADWTAGNENYYQRWTGPETNIINNETDKLNNNAGNFNG